MDEDDLVSYRQYTANTTGGSRGGGKKRPAPQPSPPPPQRTTTDTFDMDEDEILINPTATAAGDTTYTVLSQQSMVGLQQSEDIMADMTDDEDEEN
jgi:hypothetical protein